MKDTKSVICEHFFSFPNAKMRVRGIERELGLSLPSVIRYCRELCNEGILSTVTVGDVVFYTADKASAQFRFAKRLHNLRILYVSGIMEHLRSILSNPTIVVFGSYARGEDDETSDIDIYIETASNKRLDLLRFEKVVRRDIQIFRHFSLHEIKNRHLANNIINGVVLNGAIVVL